MFSVISKNCIVIKIHRTAGLSKAILKCFLSDKIFGNAN